METQVSKEYPHTSPRISSPFCSFAFLGSPFFSTNQAKQIFICWGPNSSLEKKWVFGVGGIPGGQRPHFVEGEWRFWLQGSQAEKGSGPQQNGPGAMRLF